MNSNHELVVPDEGLPFKMFLYEGKDGNYYREKHWHRSIEIFAVLEGEMEFYIENQKYTLGAKEFILVNSNEVHSIHSPLPNTTIVIQMPVKIFEEYYTDNLYISFTHKPTRQDESMVQTIDQMYEIIQKKKIGYRLEVQSLFYKLMYLLVNNYREVEVDNEAVNRSKKLSRLSSITNYIKDNYTEDISLEVLAEVFGYSPTYISRMFQKYVQMNYKDYLRSVRMQYAYRDLMETKDSLSEIALRHGFPNSKAFAKAFMKKYGVLPSVYRKNINE